MNYSFRKSENILFAIKIFFTILIWISIIAYFIRVFGNQPDHSIVTVTTILVYVGIILLYVWFYKVYLVAYMKGNGICVSEEQFADIHAIYCDIARQLNIKKIPPLFILQSGGLLNAFAVRLSRRNYIAIYSDIFSLYTTDIETVKFVLAHELAHVKNKHMQKRFWTFPSSIIPFLSSAYSRVCEYNCDSIGSIFVSEANSKLNGLLLLAGGKDLYKEININNYLTTAKQNRSLSVKFVNLLIFHPYLPDRIINIQRS